LKDRKDVTFVCAGDGDSRIYNDMIDNENRDYIVILGFQKNIESIMNICDIGVLVSDKTKHQEGISNALLEFMALGKPVIANDNGGNKELIINDKNGFILSDDCFMDVKEKINLLLSDEKLREEFSKESIKIVKEKFSIDKMIDLFINEYELLIKKAS